MEIIEGNKIIAEFMGAEWVQDDYGDWGYKSSLFPQHYQYWAAEALLYNYSWDWLMLVVEKIESLSVIGKEENVITYEQQNVEWQFSVEIMNGGCVIHRDVLPQYHGTDEDFLKLYSCLKTDKINSTWLAVIEFITWHKTQTP